MLRDFWVCSSCLNSEFLSETSSGSGSAIPTGSSYQLLSEPLKLLTAGFVCVCVTQMGLESLQKEFVRLEEHPFTSEQKWMAVRCVHRTQQVSTSPPSSEAVVPKSAAEAAHSDLSSAVSYLEVDLKLRLWLWLFCWTGDAV